ncbi:MAG: OmpA family protein [Cyanobacteria bacterium J06629_9]
MIYQPSNSPSPSSSDGIRLPEVSNRPPSELDNRPDLPPTDPNDGSQDTVPASRSWLHLGLTVTFRLLLLGVSLPLAWLVGIGAAQVLGSRSDRVPLQETALRRVNRVVTEVRYLPERWQQPDRSVTRVEPVPIPTEPIEPLSQAATTLSDSERQVALEEVDAIATDLRSLNRRLIDLETKLGRAQSTADIESRLASIRSRLDPTAPPTDSPAPAAALPAPVAPDPLFETTDLQVTLPSDALFVPGDARLLETAPVILGTILNDLGRYPNATILVGSHTDDRSDQTISRELAFRQASILQRYLAASLDSDRSDSRRRWVPIGYGQGQPLGDNDSPEARQRNRRVEISVDRR